MHYEWNGEEYEPRSRRGDTDCEPFAWEADMKPEQWRQVLLELLDKPPAESGEAAPDPHLQELLRQSVASFSDGINSGYYINSYTTKQCPTMEGLLEELQRGLGRLQGQRNQEQQRRKELAAKLQEPAEKDQALDAEEQENLPRAKSAFAEALRTLNRLSSSPGHWTS